MLIGIAQATSDFYQNSIKGVIMASEGSLTIADYNNERSTSQVRVADVTAVNAADTLTRWGEYRAAVEDVILGVVQSERLYFFNTKLSNAIPSDVNAQIERKWQIFYEGDTPTLAVGIANPYYRQIFVTELATANLADGRLLPNSDEADLTETTMLALKTKFEALYTDPAGKAIRVLKIVATGSRR